MGLDRLTPTDETLIRFKTDAWKGTGMVAGYAERMHENRGTNRLKNEVEVSLCRLYARGQQIVDVGIGTGRASLPLAHDGRDVTGVDVSQAMLDQCRREADTIPVTLVQGDLTHLPLPDESCDTLLSLNVAVHFPNWRDALADWARVVRPGGRVVFDVHSRDHLDAVAAANGCDPEALLSDAQRNDPTQFMLRVTAAEVAEAAAERGLCVKALIPYAAVLGGGNVNYWLKDSRLWDFLGDRALSWIALDDRLYEFGLFLERDVFGRLSTASTGRFMIVLEKRSDDGSSRAVLERNAAIDRVFAQAPSFGALSAVVPEAASWPEQLRAHLQHPRNVTLLAMALSGPLGSRLNGFVQEMAGADAAAIVSDAQLRRQIDDEIHGFARSWYRTATDPENFVFEGVDLGPSCEYDVMKNLLLTEYFGKVQP